jgi:hypothetical protein
LRFDDDIVNIDFQVAPYLPLEAELNTPLISGPCILQSEWHFHVAETTEWGDEHGGGLVLFRVGYLVVTQVGI